VNNTILNYDGGISTSPKQVAYPETVGEIQAILQDTRKYPSPVRAMGSYHSLTPCASSDGTIINTSRMNRVVKIDPKSLTFTAQAGLQVIDASLALRTQNLQLMTNIEIGNMTLGAAACCHTKDGLDGKPLGQVSSHVVEIKWVDPNGQLRQVDTSNTSLLSMVRSSYGLCGVVYEATFSIKPLQAIQLTYLPRTISRLTQNEVDSIINDSEGLVCWTVGRTANFQRKEPVAKVGPFGSWFAAGRRRIWNHTVAHLGRLIDVYVPSRLLRSAALAGFNAGIEVLYYGLHFTGGHTLMNPDKIVDYRSTPASSKYAFTFWAFPRDQWLDALREYLQFADKHYEKYGFRCNMPLGSYYIRKDSSSILSYSYDGDVISIDPIHAYSDKGAWDRFLQDFNEFASKRKGIPLLNQSPHVTKDQVQAAYGARWHQFSQWAQQQDPMGRMLNPFFKALL
jgi:UDP-N-acetylenolpyruvoylglucosamine reductase